MPAVLVDTNILVHAHNATDPVKQTQAIQVLDHLHTNGIGRLSAQTLAEFFAATTGGTRSLLTIVQASKQVENLSISWTVLDINSLIVIEAIRGVREHKFSYWDAQVWAIARLNQIPVVFTEDFNPGAVIEGIRFVNPFATGFVLTDWQ